MAPPAPHGPPERGATAAPLCSARRGGGERLAVGARPRAGCPAFLLREPLHFERVLSPWLSRAWIAQRGAPRLADGRFHAVDTRHPHRVRDAGFYSRLRSFAASAAFERHGVTLKADGSALCADMQGGPLPRGPAAAPWNRAAALPTPGCDPDEAGNWVGSCGLFPCAGCVRFAGTAPRVAAAAAAFASRPTVTAYTWHGGPRAFRTGGLFLPDRIFLASPWGEKNKTKQKTISVYLSNSKAKRMCSWAGRPPAAAFSFRHTRRESVALQLSRSIAAARRGPR